MFTMYDLNMNRIQYPEGFIPLDIAISSIARERNTSLLEGSNTRVDNGASFTSREIKLHILLKSKNTYGYRLIRNEAYDLFSRYDKFYVVENNREGIKYLISVDDSYSADRITGDVRHSVFIVECTTPETPYGESIGRSSDIQRDGINSEEGLWGFGMGLEAIDETLKYIHTVDSGQTFRVFNPGIKIHPFEQDLKIKIKDVYGSDNAFQINNLTNGSRFWSDVPIKTNDVVEIDGHRVTKNGLNFLRDTGKRYIELNRGWNTFIVLDRFSTKSTIEFDFPFYYY